ncbi:MAG TPA: DEAD/DEAH box helicase [Actinomycetota bacterium]|nr:DEAD/DEAH box helicase [Actinomycetota bacterium]
MTRQGLVLRRARKVTTLEEAPAAHENATFESLGIPGDVLARLRKRGFDRPFPVQARVLPFALAGRDVFGQAQTGSGKTLAFAIPIVAAARTEKSKNPFALVMVPTRELAAQVAEEVDGISGGLRVMAAYGGRPVAKDLAKLQRGIDVVVATPGRLADLYERGAMVLDEVSILVLDEADRMLDLGFMYDMDWLIRRLPAKRQTMLFSATLATTVRQLARRYMSDPEHVDVAAEGTLVEDVDHRFFLVHPMDKLQVLLALVAKQPLTIVFTRTKRYAARLNDELKRNGIAVAALHGDMPQGARTKALADFTAGKAKILVASDVAARGLDVAGVEQVINYDPPEDPTAYTHRAGRTARAGATGLCVTLCTSGEKGHVELMLRRLGLDAAIEEVFSTSPVLKEMAS